MRNGPPDIGLCMSGDDCSEQRADHRRFCVDRAEQLDRIGRSIRPRGFVPRFTSDDARAAWVAKRDAERAEATKATEDEADTTPRLRASMCRVVGCVKAPRDAETTCYRHRGVPEGVDVVENVCAVESCERTATSSAGRCKLHPVKADPVAVAA